MTKTKSISILLASFLIVLFLLSAIGILSLSFTGILCILLIVAGIGLAYIGIGDKSDFIVFLGTVLFLIGVLLLTKLSFNLYFENTAFISIVLLISAIGFIMIYINSPLRKIYLVITLVLLSSSVVLFVTKSKFGLSRFFEAILPLINVYWPAIIIFLLLVILLSKEK